jgi:subtilisin family serine protease
MPAIIARRDAARPGGLRFVRADITFAQARKLADDPEVVAVMPNKAIEVPPVPGPHLTWESLSQGGAALPLATDPIAPATWFAKDVHGASAAWAAGYTGAGVKVAIVDEGIDFGHPDLEGCQARVTDPSSPYFGWPIAFDPPAMAAYAASRQLFMGGYTNTYLTVTGTTAVFRGRTYTLPGTSKSGIYHIGAHPSYWLPFIIGDWGAPAAVLVADESAPGVYDTVYVDINKDYDFRNDKPCRRGDEAAWVDLDGDGLADLSAGMVYFIADGIHPIPASDWLYHLAPPANGTLVAFAGAFGKDENHGTLVASAVAARGKVGTTYSLPQKPPGSGGMVYGMAPGAGIIQVGNVYASYADLYDAIQFAIAGYDGIPGTGDEADIVNMSFSISTEDADGWDFLSRYIAYLNETVAPRTTFVAAIGNGGPGYGTVSSPGGSSSVVTVGAATLYGSTDAFGPIHSADQILYGDIQQWSDRGPSSLGQIKPEVAAVGAWATGDVPIYGSGEYAWGTWGGTSLSAPITCGILALIYDAYRSHHGSFPDHDEARTILMAGARDLCYNALEQGAGMADAARSTGIAAGTGGFVVRPASWAAGTCHAFDPPAFPHVLSPGEAKVKEFTIENTGPAPLRLSVEGRRLLRTGSAAFEIETRNYAEDQYASMSRPDYLVDLSRAVPTDADLLRIRISFPYTSFSLTDPASRWLWPSSLWMVSLFDWTDVDGDGSLWTDTNANGVVNAGELQEEEVNRFMIASPWSDVIELSAKRPMERVHNGLLLGLHHTLKNADISSTRLRVELEFYRQVEWDWLDVRSRPLTAAPGQTVRLPVKLHAPHDATQGIYSGALVVSDDGGEEVRAPISVVVTAHGNWWSPTPPLVHGSDRAGDTYDNGRMFGAFDWSWREESGDWRFYFTNVPPQRPKTTPFILANAHWPDMPADTDILIYRPDKTDYFSTVLPQVFGPYGLALSGSSRRTHTTAGMWPFETATGGASEWVAGRAEPGLNLIQLHNVLDSGKSGAQPFELEAGLAWLDPGELELAPGQTSASVRFTSSIRLPGLSALSFGFAAPQTLTGLAIRQEIPDRPSAAKWTKDLTVTRAGLIEVSTDSTDPIDIDLYLLYDANGDGAFDWTYEVVAVSGTSTAAEHIRYYLPKDGRYRIAVHGYRVPSPSKFNIRILVVDGKDLQVSIPRWPIRGGCPATLGLSFPPAPAGGTGIVFLGPPEAPGVIPVPVNVREH